MNDRVFLLIFLKADYYNSWNYRNIEVSRARVIMQNSQLRAGEKQEYIHCYLCGKDTYKTIITSRSATSTPFETSVESRDEVFKLVKCKSCGLHYDLLPKNWSSCNVSIKLYNWIKKGGSRCHKSDTSLKK